jgi:hypothetical protein
MRVSEEKKTEYWNALAGMVRGTGLTAAKLRRAKPLVWNDDHFWFDIVIRHGGLDKTPTQMSIKDPAVFDHCLGNFCGMLADVLHR